MKAKIKMGSIALGIDTPLSDDDGNYVFVSNKTEGMIAGRRVTPHYFMSWLHMPYMGNAINMWHLFECIQHQPTVVEGDQEWYEQFKVLLDKVFTKLDYFKYINYTLNHTNHSQEKGGDRMVAYLGQLRLYKKWKADNTIDLVYTDTESLKALKLKSSIDDWDEATQVEYDSLKQEIADDLGDLQYNEYFKARKELVLQHTKDIEILFGE